MKYKWQLLAALALMYVGVWLGGFATRRGHEFNLVSVVTVLGGLVIGGLVIYLAVHIIQPKLKTASTILSAVWAVLFTVLLLGGVVLVAVMLLDFSWLSADMDPKLGSAIPYVAPVLMVAGLGLVVSRFDRSGRGRQGRANLHPVQEGQSA